MPLYPTDVQEIAVVIVHLKRIELHWPLLFGVSLFCPTRIGVKRAFLPKGRIHTVYAGLDRVGNRAGKVSDP